MRHKKSVMRSMMMITQLGLTVMVPVFVCILAGYYIDRYTGMNLTFFLMLLGFAAGGLGGYKMAKTTLAMNEREERAEEERDRMERKKQDHPQVNRPKTASRVKRDASEELQEREDL